jgi:hypothetical protein
MQELFQSFRALQNDKTNSLLSPLVPSVEQTTAMLEKEETEQDARMQGSSPTGVESTAFGASMQQKSSINEMSQGASSVEQQVGPDGRHLFELGWFFRSRQLGGQSHRDEAHLGVSEAVC